MGRKTEICAECLIQTGHWAFRAFLTKVDTGSVKKKSDDKGIERCFDSIKT